MENKKAITKIELATINETMRAKLLRYFKNGLLLILALSLIILWL
ncbi:MULTISPECIES: hypothetical protein [unclassified Flavobacterium]|nr:MULTISPECIES: hypothetical protein [unclassified Flavobacterium]